MLDGRKLRDRFTDFNVAYFGNRLPPYAIHVVHRINWLDGQGETNRERRLIKIRRGLPDEEAISILLHEMVHAATGDGHGRKWKRKMIELRDAGAPLVAADRTVSLDDWDGTRVSQRMFRAHVEDELCAYPDKTLACAVRDFICNVGGAETVSEFLRKYPWASAVFTAMQKEFREYQKARAASRGKQEETSAKVAPLD